MTKRKVRATSCVLAARSGIGNARFGVVVVRWVTPQAKLPLLGEGGELLHQLRRMSMIRKPLVLVYGLSMYDL